MLLGAQRPGSPPYPWPVNYIRPGCRCAGMPPLGSSSTPNTWRSTEKARERGASTFELLAGAGNFTRRNICNYNLETSLKLIAPGDVPLEPGSSPPTGRVSGITSRLPVNQPSLPCPTRNMRSIACGGLLCMPWPTVSRRLPVSAHSKDSNQCNKCNKRNILHLVDSLGVPSA